MSKERKLKVRRKEAKEYACKPGHLLETVEALEDSLSRSMFQSAAVLSNYYGSGTLRSYSSSSDVSLKPSSYLAALESLTHQNALRSVIDTALSQLVRTPDVRISTIGATWGKQRSARKLGQWISGSMLRAGMPDIQWQVATDSKTCPLAAARFWFEDDGLHAARVRPDQILYNPREGKKPRNLYLRYGAPRGDTEIQYGLEPGKLKNTPDYHPHHLYEELDLIGPPETDECEIIEHWHLGKGEEPGYHVIVAGDTVLCEEEWCHDFFPVVELVHSGSWDSFGGQSLGAQLMPYQLRLNRMNRTIDIAQEKMSIGRVLLPKGSEIDKQKFSKTIGEFIEYNNVGGGQPVIQPGQAAEPAYYQRLESTLRAMYELAGVSVSQAQGTIPAGMAGASGKALREYQDVASTRMKEAADRMDRWYERCCRVVFALACDWFGNGGKGSKVKAPGTSVLEEIDFKSLDIDEDDGIEVRCISVSSLPAHPGARLEYVQELLKSGIIQLRYAAKLLSIADIEAFEDNVTNAAIDLATHHIEATLYDAKVVTPEPHREYLTFLQDIGGTMLLRAVRLEAPEENVELLRRLLAIGKNQLDQLPADVPAQMPQMPMAASPGQATAPGSQAPMVS